LTISSQAETITFPNPGPQTYGVAPITLAATASSGLTVSYAVTSGPASVSGNALTITGVGSVTVQATQSGNSGYQAAAPASVSFTVNPAALTVTANNASRAFAAANPALTGTITGLQNNDNITATYSTTATQSSEPGTYPIVPALVDPGNKLGNYTVTLNNGTLTVLAPAVNPLPGITSLNPGLATAGSAGFTLTVTGANFLSGAVVQWNGSARTTTLINASQLTAAITAADLQSVGTASVTVVNPSPGGGASEAFEFAIDGVTSGGTAGTSSISVTAQNGTLDVQAGATASFSVTFQGAKAGAQVTASCWNLPAGATCSYNSSTGTMTIQTSASTPPGSYQDILIVFTVTEQTAALAHRQLILASWSALLGLPLGLAWIGGGRKRTVRLVVAVLFALSLAWLAGCGGRSTVSSTSGMADVQSSLMVTLNVQ
jgi:hypothetical protein